jgi:hypothetical protein
MNKYFKSIISGFIPAIEYCFNFLFMSSLVICDIKDPFLGLIEMKTFPYSGGDVSSPPYAITLSTFGYMYGINPL